MVKNLRVVTGTSVFSTVLAVEFSLLLHAMYAGHAAVVSCLLEAGADPSMTIGGQTAVDIARAFEHTEIINRLTEYSSPQPSV